MRIKRNGGILPSRKGRVELFGFLQSQIALGLTPFTSAAVGKQYRIDRVTFLKSTFLLCAHHTSSEPAARWAALPSTSYKVLRGSKLAPSCAQETAPSSLPCHVKDFCVASSKSPPPPFPANTAVGAGIYHNCSSYLIL